MTKAKMITAFVCAVTMMLSVALGGCATKGETGALVGAGTGALIGGLANMHGSWGATALIGAGVGAGVGYLIGNEQDKKEASNRRTATEGELKPLAGTVWQVVSISPQPRNPYKSVVTNFRTDGFAVTTSTNMDGRVDTQSEQYRIVGSTLILSKPDYVENVKFRLEADKLFLDYGNGSMTLRRIS